MIIRASALLNRAVLLPNPTAPPNAGGRVPPRALGEQSELDAFAELHRAGYTVLLCPFRATRYDCVVDTGGTLHRVQIKTGRVVRGAIHVHTRSCSGGGRSRPYFSEAELFGVWVPELRRLYLVPVADCGRRALVLRLLPPGNRQNAGVRWASQYEVKALPGMDGSDGGRITVR